MRRFLSFLLLELGRWAILGAILTVIYFAKVTQWFATHGTWQWWWWIFAAILVPPFVVWATTLGAESRVPTFALSTIAPLTAGPRGFRTRIRWFPGVLRGAAIALGFLALARPTRMVSEDQTTERGIDIVIVLDLSGSMKAVMDQSSGAPRVGRNGYRPTRLDTAKEVITDFIARRKTDRIGVIVFGKAAYVLSPATLDYAVLTTLVSKMDLSLIDGNGTAIGDAVGAAVARLRRSDARSKAIILLTDGDSNSGSISPDYATHLAETEAVRVYTVQIGNGDDVDVQDGVDLFGQARYVRQRFPVNPELLKTMASKTGGDSFVATDKGALERSMHEILDHLEKTKFLAQAGSREELFPWFLAPAMILLLLEGLVRTALLRRFP